MTEVTIESIARDLVRDVIASPGWETEADAYCEALALHLTEMTAALPPEAPARQLCAAAAARVREILTIMATDIPRGLVEFFDLLPVERQAEIKAEALDTLK